MSSQRISYLVSSGNSMLPFIPSDSVLEIKSRSSHSNWQVGEVAAFFHETKVIAHRIIRIDSAKHQILTQGDNNLHSDGWMSLNHVIGLVTRVSRYDFDLKLELPSQGLVIYLIRAMIKSHQSSMFFLAKALHSLFKWLIYFASLNYFSTPQILASVIKSHKTGAIEGLAIEWVNRSKGRGWVLDRNRRFVELLQKNKVTELPLSRSIAAVETLNELLSQQKVLAVRQIRSCFKRNGIEFLPLKQFGHSLSKPIWRSDIDLIVKKQQLNQALLLLKTMNFVEKNHTEHSWTMAKDGLEIDLHVLVALPRHHLVDQKQISALTQKIWSRHHRDPSDQTWLLLADLVNFWNNDFGKGLGVYKRIYDAVYSTPNSQMILTRLFSYSNKLGLEWLVILLVGRSEIIMQGVNSSFIRNRASKIRWLSTELKSSRYFGKLIVKSPKQMWWYEASRAAWPFALELFYLQLIFDKNTPTLRLMRPRILIYLTIVWFEAISSGERVR